MDAVTSTIPYHGVMKIEWNKVTWYSKLATLIVFIGTFVLAFAFGMLYENAYVQEQLAAVAAFSSSR